MSVTDAGHITGLAEPVNEVMREHLVGLVPKIVADALIAVDGDEMIPRSGPVRDAAIGRAVGERVLRETLDAVGLALDPPTPPKPREFAD